MVVNVEEVLRTTEETWVALYAKERKRMRTGSVHLLYDPACRDDHALPVDDQDIWDTPERMDQAAMAMDLLMQTR